MKTAVIGGGNIGTLLAAEMLRKGHEVTVYTSRPGEWKEEISVLDASDAVLWRAKTYRATDQIGEALQSAALVFITMPAQMFPALAQLMEPYIRKDMMLGVVPGSGGAEFIFSGWIKKGSTLFGFQRVHSIARIRKYGEAVYMLGRKPELYLASIPSSQTAAVASIMESIFDLPCICLPNYLSVTLTPSNPILHTTRLYRLFADYKPGMVYADNYLFYKEWDDESSQLLIDCDQELQRLCSVIPLDLKHVKSLREHYESDSVSAMTRKIRSIEAFQSLRSPMKKAAGGWVPDFESRYFVADFSYGLKILKEIAMLFDVPVPHMTRVWDWYRSVDVKGAEHSFELDMKKEDLIALYSL